MTADLHTTCTLPPTAQDGGHTLLAWLREMRDEYRVVIEKPFGHDLRSARELNDIVNDVFPEESVFRIDHYLGKETVQNILALRFANPALRADLEQQLRRP